MKKNFFIIAILFYSICTSFSQSISNELLKKLKDSGELQNVILNEENVNLLLSPNTELSNLATKNWNNEYSPRLVNEKLFYLNKRYLGENPTIDKVSKVIRSISTMKGTQYYSNRHKEWTTLYHDAYLIDSPKNKAKIDDDINGSADGKKLYCMQDDNSFGKCFYELNYKQREKEISVCFDNFEPLKFGVITAAKSHNVKINLVVLDEGDYFLVYLLVQAYYPRISFLEDKMIDSFNARVDSIYKWFVKEMSK